WISIQTPGDGVILRSELNAGDVFHSNRSTFRRLAHHNLSKFFGRREPSLSANGVSKLLSGWNGFATHFSRGIDRVLRLDRIHDFGNGNCQLGKLIRLHPDPHRILAGAKDLDLPDSR